MGFARNWWQGSGHPPPYNVYQQLSNLTRIAGSLLAAELVKGAGRLESHYDMLLRKGMAEV